MKKTWSRKNSPMKKSARMKNMKMKIQHIKGEMSQQLEDKLRRNLMTASTDLGKEITQGSMMCIKYSIRLILWILTVYWDPQIGWDVAALFTKRKKIGVSEEEELKLILNQGQQKIAKLVNTALKRQVIVPPLSTLLTNIQITIKTIKYLQIKVHLWAPNLSINNGNSRLPLI